ncbi:Serine/threonine-protein kinase PknB [Rubripirellula lacrimiformis]|uniref:Serine/threonine-protein kinase PknB n=1 Tax=Rubripirellula lacrimiformis TaxID=1930273 RepID=A0A517ND90_9BACT|nr:protein kinase [Rubripirellula lacrimiformis]QDT05099.1 Serine/threonine-protein kinase PknB [Rubripirellula lacrimiformis]
MEPDTRPEEKSKLSESITDRPDRWLLRAWKSGDERAAEVLFDRYAIRLVALVASRLNRRYQASIDPSEVVQSAMGSFFDAARHSRIQASRSVSLWPLLATFARRKMARSIERQSAAKRGGGQSRLSLDSVERQVASDDESNAYDEADAFLTTLKTELPEDLFVIVEGLLAGQAQRELAESLGIDERTVRRRLSRVRQLLDPNPARVEKFAHVADSAQALPRVNYNEFVLGKLIGSGGFGKVYRASMQSGGRTVVAVKFLRKAFWQNEGARESFLREINIASQINHPGVIRYLGFGESPHGGPYVISEWIDGRSLQEVSSVAPKQIIVWLRQICEAIGAVHQAGLVHGDLSPSNVLVDADDRITITDFGFSQASADSSSQVMGGTLGFAAPEQIAPAFGSISVKTDIYAIGGLIHWLLFRTPPSTGHCCEEALVETLSGHDPEVPPDEAVPEALLSILADTLRKSPADRTITVAGIVTKLDSALRSR